MMYYPLRNVCANMRAEGPDSTSVYAIAWRPRIAPGTDQVGTVHAISAETGETAWIHEQRSATMSLVATGGGLVFGGDVNGRFRALDQESGEVLWEINLVHQPDAGAAPERRQQPLRVRLALAWPTRAPRSSGPGRTAGRAGVGVD